MDATRYNIVSPTMLRVGGVGTCCVVHANERNMYNYQLKKQCILVLYSNLCNARAQTFLRGQHCCGSMQTGATLLLHRSYNNRTVGTCCAKSLIGFKLYATSANKRQHCQGSMQTDATCWAQQCCVLLSVCIMGLKNILGLRDGEELLFWILDKIRDVVSRLTNVRKCMCCRILFLNHFVFTVCSYQYSLKNRGHLTEYRVPLNCSWRGESYVLS